MNNKVERRSSRHKEKKIPNYLFVPTILYLLFLIVATANDTFKTRELLNQAIMTATAVSEYSTSIAPTRSKIVQQTATAVANNQKIMDPYITEAVKNFYPTNNSACGQTILRVGQLDHDQQPKTPPLTLIQSLTAYHCVEFMGQNLHVDLGNEVMPARSLNISPLGETPISEMGESDPATLLLYVTAPEYYQELAHLNSVLKLVDGSDLPAGTSVNYCGYAYAINHLTYSKGLPPTMRCNTSLTQGYDTTTGLLQISPAVITGGDSGGIATLTKHPSYIVGTISGTKNPVLYGPSVDIANIAPIPPLGPSMAEIQWDLAMSGAISLE